MRKHTTSNINQDSADSLDYIYASMDLGVEQLPPELRLIQDNIWLADDGVPYKYGTKSRMADALAAEAAVKNAEYLTYRGTSGLALAAITAAANAAGLKTRFFTFARKAGLTPDLLYAMSQGAEVSVRRYAAASHLNKCQQTWCDKNHGVLIPLGLPSVSTTAAIIQGASKLDFNPDIVVTVAGSATLSRALQIAYPDALVYMSPVSRNIKKGEKGRAEIIDYQLPFTTEPPLRAPWNCMQFYDGKAWQLALDVRAMHPDKSILIWNVGHEPNYENIPNYDVPDCGLPWHKEMILVPNGSKLDVSYIDHK